MQRFKNILFVADNGPGQAQAFARALRLAEENHSGITVMDTVDDFADMPRYYSPSVYERMYLNQAKLLKERHKSLMQLVDETVGEYPGVSIDVEVWEGRLFIEVIRTVLKNNHDLVIKAPNFGMGRIQRLFGSMDIGLLRQCPCPVWIVKPSDHKHFARILAAVDPDPNNSTLKSLNRLILDLATSLAESENSELDVVHASEAYGEVALRSGHLSKGTGARFQEEMRETHEIEINELLTPYASIDKTVHLANGDARDTITDLAMKNNVDLIVMGAVERYGIPGRIIVNPAEKVISGTDCSLLEVKSEEFVTPVDAGITYPP